MERERRLQVYQFLKSIIKEHSVSILPWHVGFILKSNTLMVRRNLPPGMEHNSASTSHRISHSSVSCWPKVAQACPSMKQLPARSLHGNKHLRWSIKSGMVLGTPFYTRGKWRARKLNDLPRITQLWKADVGLPRNKVHALNFCFRTSEHILEVLRSQI